jgi:hypothetical protein
MLSRLTELFSFSDNADDPNQSATECQQAGPDGSGIGTTLTMPIQIVVFIPHTKSNMKTPMNPINIPPQEKMPPRSYSLQNNKAAPAKQAIPIMTKIIEAIIFSIIVPLSSFFVGGSICRDEKSPRSS